MKVFFQKEKQDSLVQMSLIHNNKGQSLAEFILTFGIVCVVMILFVKIAFNFTKGYMIHYANFMASRAYMVQDNNSSNPQSTDGDARNIAINNVYKKIFDKVPTSRIVTLTPSSVENKVFVGIKTTIDEEFSLSPMVGGGEKIKLVSESFLGREPVVSECAIGTCEAIREVSGESCENDFVTLWDNGC